MGPNKENINIPDSSVCRNLVSISSMKMNAYEGANLSANSPTPYLMFNLTIELKVVILKHKHSHFEKMFRRDLFLFPSVQ